MLCHLDGYSNSHPRENCTISILWSELLGTPNHRRHPSLTVASTGDDGIDMNQVAPPTPPSSGINAEEAASDELAPKRMTIKSVKTMRGANKKALNATKLKDKDNVTSDIEAATEGAI